MTEIKDLFSVSVNYAADKEEPDKEHWKEYVNLESVNSAQELVFLLMDREKGSEGYSNVVLRINLHRLSEEQYQRMPSGNPRTIGEICFDSGKITTEEISCFDGKRFVRDLFFCDIIKGWDYKPF